MSRNMQQIAQIAIFMDFTALNESFEVGRFTNRVRQFGRILIQKAYVDATRYNVLKREMVENAVELLELPFIEAQGTSHAEVRLTVDVLETAFMQTHIDTYILCIGENDYTALFSKLRSLNKRVIVISETSKWQERWRKYCDEVFDYEAFLEKKEETETTQVNLNGTTTNRIAGRSVYGTLKTAITMLSSKEEVVYDWQIKEYLQSPEVQFNVEDYSFKTWEGFWEKAKNDCVIECVETDKGLAVSLFNVAKVQENNAKLVAESLGLFYQAAISCPVFDDNKITLSDIAIFMRRIMPNYTPPTSGTRGRGFKAIMLEAESKGYVKVFSQVLNGSIQYYVQILPKFHEDFAVKTSEVKPPAPIKNMANTQIVPETKVYTQILSDQYLSANLDVIKSLYDKIDEYVFSTRQNEDVSIKEVYSYCMADAKDKETLYKKAFNTILGSNLLFSANNTPITKVYMPLIVEEMELYEDAIPQIKAFIKVQIETQLKQQVPESKLQDLFYAKIVT